MIQYLIDFAMSPVTWALVSLAVVFTLGISGGWLLSNWSSAKDADDGNAYIYWRAKRYRVVPDDMDDERRDRHKHGSMAEQSWP